MSSIRRPRDPAESDSLATYLQELRSYPLLTRAQELALGARIRAGDDVALDRLVCANLRFVVSIAKRYHFAGVPLADLISEGNVGLVRAARRFDERKGVRFITYAIWWVRQAILQALSEYSHTIHIPMSQLGRLHGVTSSARELGQELGREPTQQEIATELGVSEDEIAATMSLAIIELSLDAPLLEQEDGTMLDVLARDDARSTADDAKLIGLEESLEEAMSRLRDREVEILRLYFGFDGQEPMTLEEIGHRLGVTRERVRQIKQRALAKLRRSSAAPQLAAFAGG